MVAASHELGHDEAQAWNIARSSSAWLDVAWTSRYEGHTPLWFAILWPLALSGNPLLMQCLALGLGLITAVLLLLYRSVPRWVCWLIIIGYFVGYEYSLLPRPYIVAITLCLLLAVSIAQGWFDLKGRALLCGLIAFTSAFGVALSVSLITLVYADQLLNKKRSMSSFAEWGLSALIYGSLALAAVYFVIWPIEDRMFESAMLSGDRMPLNSWWQNIHTAVFPHLDRLPMGIGRWFSDSGVLQNLTIAASILVAMSVFVWLIDWPAAAIGWVTAVLVLSAATVVSGTGSERHLGHLFMAALAFVWARPGLASINQVRKISVLPVRWMTVLAPRALRALAGIVLIGVLVYQAAVGVGAAGLDIAKTMTPWPAVAQFIRDRGVEDTVVFTDHAYHAGALAALLDKPLFDMRCQCWTRHELWQGSHIPESSTEYRDHLITRACELQKEHDDVLMLRVTRSWPEAAPFELLMEFPNGYRDGRHQAPRLYRMTSSQKEKCAN